MSISNKEVLRLKHNIEPEEKLIRLLGYKLVEPNKSDSVNKWLIYDENDLEVGFIRYKKIHKTRGMPAVYGYVLNIDSSTIKCHNTRSKQRWVDSKYRIYIKSERSCPVVEIIFGSNPSITLWSNEYGYMKFKMNHEMLYLNFKSKTENFKINETVLLETGMKYRYSITYYKPKFIFDDGNKEELTLEVFNDDSRTQRLSVSEMKFENNDLVSKDESIVEGTLYDAIKGHEMGIEAFSHFRFLINEALPFNEEIIEELIGEEPLSKEQDLIINGNVKRRKRNLLGFINRINQG